MSTQLRRIIYSSKASENWPREVVENLLAQSRLNNIRRDITGVLMYDYCQFWQVIEGPDANVTEVFDHICKDYRHHGIVVVANDLVDDRSFGDFSMGLTTPSEIKDEDAAEIVSTAKHTLEETQPDERRRASMSLLEGLRSRWRRFVS